MYLKHRPHKNYTWRKCSRVLTNCLVVTKMSSKCNLYVSCASKGLIFWGKLAVIPKLLHYWWVMVPEGWKTSISQKSTHSKESNTSKDNDRAISFDPVKSWGHSEQQSIDISGYSEPSTLQCTCQNIFEY